MSFNLTALLVLVTLLAAPLRATASDPVTGQQKIDNSQGGLPYVVGSFWRLGKSLAAPGDFDGDGVADLVVGIPGYMFPPPAVFVEDAVDILLLNTDGTVKDHHLVTRTDVDNSPGYVKGIGESIAALGDLDGNGVIDLALGQPEYSSDPFNSMNEGAVYIVFMNADGTVASSQRISAVEGGFSGGIAALDRFGSALANLGDVDGDGVTDLAVGAPAITPNFPPGSGQGTVYILFLNADGTVKTQATIDAGQVPLTLADGFGMAVAGLGDRDGDGTLELAVGAPRDDDGGNVRGVVWILSIDSAGAVASSLKLGSTSGIVGLDDGDFFGNSLAAIGDWNADGIGADLAVGAPLDDDGGTDRGAVHMLTLKFDGSVQTQTRISATAGGFTGSLADFGLFGRALAMPGDLDGDGNNELAVGAPFGGSPGGAVWNLFLLDPLPPYFVNLGKSLKGTPFLPPETIGTGILKAGFGLNIILRNALPAAPATLVTGFASLTAPFKGGTMVPDPATILGGFNTGPTGVVTIGAAWPAGIPAGFDFTLQWWIADAGGPAGFAASNGLKGIAQ